MTTPSSPTNRRVSLLRSIGPAIIVASVVLGPGSILTSSKVGCQFGYEMIWVLAVAAFLMFGMVALSARLGVVLDGTLCEELRSRAGRGWSLLVGISLFLIAGCFQFSNNVGIFAALEPFFPVEGSWWPDVLLVTLNLAIIGALFGMKKLYVPVERLMKLLVAVMIVGFLANLLLAQPSVWAIVTGFLPRLPEGAADSILPHRGPEGKVVDNLFVVQALIGTTFSVGGAFYQSYLVRQKGWKIGDLQQGLVDSACGIAVLGLITMMIMVTAAAVLHQVVDPNELSGAADVARQLTPLFGRGATVLFCLGIFAGAFSSFLINAMIGGSVLSDGLGWGGYLDQPGPKYCTVAALLGGMGVALWMRAANVDRPVNLIIFAQAMTVLGNPVLAAVMLYLATRRDLTGQRAVPLWIKVLAAIGLVLVTYLALRTGIRLWLDNVG
jgi:manganese transport protein